MTSTIRSTSLPKTSKPSRNGSLTIRRSFANGTFLLPISTVRIITLILDVLMLTCWMRMADRRSEGADTSVCPYRERVGEEPSSRSYCRNGTPDVPQWNSFASDLFLLTNRKKSPCARFKSSNRSFPYQDLCRELGLNPRTNLCGKGIFKEDPFPRDGYLYGQSSRRGCGFKDG